MKKSLFLVFGILILLAGAFAAYWFLLRGNTIAEKEAIEIVKEANSDLRGYPSDDLPPKSIKTEKSKDGLYIAFIQEGSGRPIISAKCFLVKNDKSLSSVGIYTPQEGEDSTDKFDIKTCSIGSSNSPIKDNSCAVENCHGLEISCGANKPQACTTLYELGDRCLQFAECGLVAGKCQQVENQQFTQCKSCVKSCSDQFKEDAEKLFTCESKCF